MVWNPFSYKVESVMESRGSEDCFSSEIILVLVTCFVDEREIHDLILYSLFFIFFFVRSALSDSFIPAFAFLHRSDTSEPSAYPYFLLKEYF